MCGDHKKSLVEFQGRHYRNHCVNRIYDLDNRTIWIDDLYGSEVGTLYTMFTTDSTEENLPGLFWTNVYVL